jgi:ATPase complex subunit ATP10
MDQDTRMAHRRHLIKEASKGYFNDLNATRRNGGKTWVAPSVMIREDKALYFPNVTGVNLDQSEKRDTAVMCSGRVSVIAMLSTAMSEVHAKGFVEPTLQRYRSHPSFQYIQINLQENILKSLVVKMFTSRLKQAVPPDLQSTYLVSTQNMEYVREPLGMINTKIGYVYLVDEALKLRWGACADATAEEAQALLSCTGVLLNRLDKKFGRTNTTPDPGL